MTKLLPWQTRLFVATNIVCRNSFFATKDMFCYNKNYTCGSSHQWQWLTTVSMVGQIIINFFWKQSSSVNDWTNHYQHLWNRYLKANVHSVNDWTNHQLSEIVIWTSSVSELIDHQLYEIVTWKWLSTVSVTGQITNLSDIIAWKHSSIVSMMWQITINFLKLLTIWWDVWNVLDSLLLSHAITFGLDCILTSLLERFYFYNGNQQQG